MDTRQDPIGIIGVATKFPGEAETFESLWNFLLKGRSAWTPIPENRIGPGHYHPDINHRGTHTVRGGHFLSEDPTLFDAPFFNITRSELAALDPQQRLVLENVYHVLENAGLTLPEVTGSDTSVYVSGFNHDHLLNLSADPETHLKYRATGTTNSLLSNRVSWFYDLKGPSMTLDTACSSSMISLHLACQNLLSGESNLSIVSGVTMISYPTDVVGMSNHGFLGAGGKCYSFDHRAEGYGRGEGVGSIVVKRLSDAIRDGNTIRAVIRASAVNQDGRTPGISLPSTEAQVKLIRKVYESAGLDPRDTLMVEAHGTGTAAGDPIEAAAIARSFPGKSADAPLFVGSIKSSVGHLEGGAGVAGIIKSILILENGIIPPNANFEKPNPRIPVDRWHLKFPTEPTPWPTSTLRRISVNSFGVGGTNGHAILDDAYHYLTERGLQGLHNTRRDVPTAEEVQKLVAGLKNDDRSEADEQYTNGRANGHVTNADIHGHTTDHVNGYTNGHSNGTTNGSNNEATAKSPNYFILLTANDEQGVQRNAQKQASYLQAMEHPKSEAALLRNFAYTMNKRTRFPWRSFAVGSTITEVVSSLESPPKQLRVKNTPSLGFVFTGQGAQWYAMGRELLDYPLFEQSLRCADEYYKSLGATWSLVEELARSKKDTKLSQPWLAHPACTALQMAAVDLLESWGVTPKRVVGHSSGEIAAAYCAGLLTREGAWKTAYYRGVVSGKQLSAKGSMMAVGLSQEELVPYIQRVKEHGAGELTVACINSPKNCTVSGDEHKIDALREILDQDNVFARTLQVMNAYHSAHMREVADDYLSLLGTLPQPTRKGAKPINYFSTLTGAQVVDTHLPASYWVENLVSPVRFSEGLLAMMAGQVVKGQASLKLNSASRGLSIDTLLEIGPHAAMQSAIKECIATRPDASTISTFGLLDRRNPNLANVLTSIGQLCIRGYPVDLLSLNQTTASQEPQVLTQLPSYSFNHSERHIAETRIVKNFRLRKNPRHDLFGAPVPDWDGESPRWRQYYTVEEQPWLKDHQITNSIIFPAVGYLVAALEAVRQITDQSESKISGYRLRDVNFKRAMVLQDDNEGVEATVSLTRMDESSLWGSPVWWRFALQSYNSVTDDWIEHCTGYISVELESTDGPIDEGRERREAAAMNEVALKGAESRCVIPVDVEATYENLVTCGISFGPTFRNLTSIWNTGARLGEASGVVSVPDIASTMPHKFLHPHVIHPATFDSMLQLFFLSLMDLEGRNTLSRPLVPTFIEECWLSAVHPSPSGQYHAYSKTKEVAYDKFESDVTAHDASSRTCKVKLRGIRTSYLESMDSQDINSRAICHELTWTPHLESLTPAALSNVPTLGEEENEKYRDQVRRFQTASIVLVLDALEKLGDVSPDSFEGHFQRYYQWMLQVRDWLDKDEASGTQRSFVYEILKDPVAKKKLLDEVAADNADGELAVRMGSNIVPVLRKEVEPLHLMFGQDDLMDRVYGQMARLGDLPALQAEYLKTVALNKTNLRVLEIGAGTGGSTVAILNELASISPEGLLIESHVKNYTFTDISAGFFEKAKDKLAPYADIMEYKVLDAEKDITQQPFEQGSYDFIVAQNVIHATVNLQNTLANVRKLLKPGGYLLLQEGVRQDFFWSGIAFGQLPGWWAGEESFRPWSPWVPVAQWDECLRAAGFAGIELNIADRSTPDLHTQSVFVVRSDKALDTSKAKVAIVTTQPLELGPTTLVKQLRERLQESFGLANTTILHLLDLADADIKDTVCLSVMELERPVLENITEQEFDNFRQMISVAKGMLWVTGDPLQSPGLAMISGITRTNRWERDVEDANLVTLHVAEDAKSQANLVEHVLSIYQKNFFVDLPSRDRNGEFLVKDGVVYTSRLVAGQGADDFLTSKFSKPKSVEMAMKDAGRPLKLSIAAPGLLDKLEWATDEAYGKPLEETEVEVETKAVGLNFRDLMIAMGEYMASAFGVEAAGVVTRVGSSVDNLKVGDRVLYINGRDTVGAFQQFGRIEQNFVVRIPDELDFETAAGLPCVYSTVMYGLDHIAKLERGEKILVHAAAGGVGQAAIQFAHYVGAEVFATVSSPAKRELLMKEYDIPEDHIFSSRDQTFVAGVLRMTKGRGVDVVLNSLAGESLRNSWEILAPLGRFIEIGKKDAQAHGKISLAPFLKNVTMSSVELPTVMRHRPALIRRLVELTVQLWKEGHIKGAVPTKTMPFSQVKEGLRILQAGKGMGKIVMVPSPDDAVPIAPEQRSPYQLRADASYVIGGGLGGIGRSLAVWMADRGARHLILLSRSGRITDEVTETLNLLEAKGCNVRVCKCDVSRRGELQKVLEECTSALPPIKGVIQGAMTLDDGMFENMTYASFQTAVLPKVQGSWNLHELLPKDLDFFVMLSSATGILGNRSQGNYAAGNTYQDMLARHRRSLGLSASTLDLGTVLSVGYAAKNRHRMRIGRHLGTVLESLREDEIHALIEYCMDAPRTGSPAQLVTGLASIGSYHAKGLPPPTFMEYPLFTNLTTVTASRPGRGKASKEVLVEALLNAATTYEDAAAVVQKAIIAKLSGLLAVPDDSIDPRRSISSNGVDSLVAMEFRAFLSKEVKADVPVLDIMGSLSLAALAQKIAGISQAVNVHGGKKAADFS